MANEVRIPVPAGLRLHHGICLEVVLREPGYEDYIELGEIVTLGKAPDGTMFPVENSEVLRAYISKCLVEPADPLVLNQGGVKLARAVKGAVLGFFRDEDSATDTSRTSPTTSSSSASPGASPPTPSAG